MKLTLPLSCVLIFLLSSCMLPYRFDIGGGSSETTIDLSPSPEISIQEQGLGLFKIRVEGKKGASYESVEEAFEETASRLCHWGYDGRSKTNLKVRSGFAVQVAKGQIKCRGYD
jgi:hypothetical protein